MDVSSIEFEDYVRSIKLALDHIQADHILENQKKILIKPNLINSSPHPVTTPKACCEAIIQYVQACSSASIVIGEGCGDANAQTDEIFEIHGYTELAKKYGVELLDLNYAPLVHKKDETCRFFKQMYLPKIAYSHFIISVPVLKAHSLAKITGTLKNMMGFAPPRYYSGKFGGWKKAVFHGNMQQAIADLNQYRSADLSIMDATIGLSEYHLGGRHCTPPVNKILASFDPKALDRKAAQILGFRWQDILHLA